IARRASAICRLLDTAINQRNRHRRVHGATYAGSSARVGTGLGACKYPLVTKLQRNAAFRNVATHEAQAPPLVPSPLGLNFFRFRIAQFLSVRPRGSGGPVFASSRLALGPPPSRDERPRGPSTHPRAHEYGP